MRCSGGRWEESGRLNDYGPELMRLTDRHDREMCLSHPREIIVALVLSCAPKSCLRTSTRFRRSTAMRFARASACCALASSS